MVLNSRRRGHFVVGTAVAMVVLALGSVAFACTSFRGAAIVTWVSGAGAGQSSGVGVTGFGGDGFGSSMGYCPGAGLTTNYPTGNLTLAHTAVNNVISVRLTSWGCTSGALTQTTDAFLHVVAGTYDVNIYDGNAFSTFAIPFTQSGINYVTDIHGNFVGDCMDKNGAVVQGVRLGSFSVNAAGVGGGTFAVPTSDLAVTNASGEFANLCVTENGATNYGGPQLPVRII
ncbi:MAG TPA: hypothetical protein VHT75_18980 [Acidimicrobiales bacterium]|jgi:hypothetical protein|nr:hypothetical protein [Acidimicrobiales bacterium]